MGKKVNELSLLYWADNAPQKTFSPNPCNLRAKQKIKGNIVLSYSLSHLKIVSGFWWFLIRRAISRIPQLN